MDEVIQNYIEKYNRDIQSFFVELRKLLFESVSCEIKERLWAKLPTFYAGDKFVRFIPFNDHINIVASTVINHKDCLEQYKITPKGMLQIYLNQEIPYITLKSIFKETLT
ncbi:DUF1801 domain-containing protein [Sedimentibacter sp.]|uniref:DUF1801 domain-containing protein n=1 Tax=Sedimentibacter sp. TaxID=1960295 RepID=UPI0028A17074|nr:DUF1801 domain-containing protein [Sedimentibacter sp.]